MVELFCCVLGYLRPHRALAAIVVAASLPTVAFALCQPLVYRAIVDDAILPRDSERLAVLVTVLVGLLGLRLAGEFAKELFAARLGVRVLNDLRLRIYDHLQALSLDFYARSKAGDIMSRCGADLEALENALAMELPTAVTRLATLGLCAGLLFSVEWRLAVASLIAIPVLSLGPRLLGRRAELAGYRRQRDLARLASMLEESIGVQPVVKAFGLRELMLARFRRRTAELAESTLRFGLVSGLMASTMTIGGLSLHALALGMGSYLAIRGEMSLGTLIAFLDLNWYVADSLQGLARLVRPLQQAASGNRRVQELLSERPRVVDSLDAGMLPNCARVIRFDRVTFGYGEDRASLRGVSFEIPIGSTVAFVGSSGSGKSTVLSLLLRLYDPASGTVSIDGHDLRLVTQASARGQMAVVFQDSFLFNTTVRENIRLGRLDATDREVEEAATAAELDQLVAELPDGYETIVGERGSRLSGGERQRMAIARAILRDPEILLLDEATSALDAGTEAAMVETFVRLGQGRTVIAVTHRLATVAHADQIFVLEHGLIAEHGSHGELMDRCGVYRRLWDKQRGLSVSQDRSHFAIDADLLGAIPLLAELGSDVLAELAQRFVIDSHPQGRVVIHQGDPGDKFYIIARGEVAVTQAGPGGEVRRLAVLQDGDYFGEIALLRDVPRTATIRTLAPTILLSLQRAQFASLLERAPHLRARLEDIHAGPSAALPS